MPACTGVADANVSVPIGHRHTVVYMRSACSSHRNRSAGMLLRYTLIRALRNSGASDIKVCSQRGSGKYMRGHSCSMCPSATQAFCSCSTCDDRLSHAETVAELRSALFCPVVNGDTAASLRLTEVILAGCIPVFVGPPWHALPLYRAVDYKSFAVFINVSDTSQ